MIQPSPSTPSLPAQDVSVTAVTEAERAMVRKLLKAARRLTAAGVDINDVWFRVKPQSRGGAKTCFVEYAVEE